jgi:hypothetical protein
MIFLNAHLEISLLKFKALTLGVDGQPCSSSKFRPLVLMVSLLVIPLKHHSLSLEDTP